MKDELREEFSNRISLLSSKNLQRNNLEIRHNLLKVVDWSSIKSLHVYRSIAHLNEVDTSWITEYLNEHYPDIHVDKGIFRRRMLIPRTQYDAIIVPLVAFDKSCNRLGRGGGWYDRFLSTQITACKIGLAYEAQYYTGVMPIETHDVPLNMVITESRIFKK